MSPSSHDIDKTLFILSPSLWSSRLLYAKGKPKSFSSLKSMSLFFILPDYQLRGNNFSLSGLNLIKDVNVIRNVQMMLPHSLFCPFKFFHVFVCGPCHKGNFFIISIPTDPHGTHRDLRTSNLKDISIFFSSNYDTRISLFFNLFLRNTC